MPSVKTSNMERYDISLFAKGLIIAWPFLERQYLSSSKLKDFADDKFKFHNNGEKLSKRVEYTAGKGEIARYEKFLLFPQCFLKTCAAYT